MRPRRLCASGGRGVLPAALVETSATGTSAGRHAERDLGQRHAGASSMHPRRVDNRDQNHDRQPDDDTRGMQQRRDDQQHRYRDVLPFAGVVMVAKPVADDEQRAGEAEKEVPEPEQEEVSGPDR